MTVATMTRVASRKYCVGATRVVFQISNRHANSQTTNRLRLLSTHVMDFQDPPMNLSSSTTTSWIQTEIHRYVAQDPIERAHTPPSSWYTEERILEYEKDHVFLCTNRNNGNISNSNNWVAVDSGVGTQGGSFQTGRFLGQPYLLTRPLDGGPLQAFYNICTHGGSCLVGPWTMAAPNNDDAAHPECRRLGPDLVGKSVKGVLPSASSSSERQRKGTFACPYHGWEFNLDGKLVKATHVKGIEDFRNKDYGLKPIAVKEVGPMVFLNFGAHPDYQTMDTNWQLLSDRLEESGFERDLKDLTLVAKEEFAVKCNWKIFVDNYGDGCYHCGYAHADLASHIDESAYSTDIMSSELSIQNAPPSSNTEDVRFGKKRAVYAQWYPNVMFNRYGPWFDVDIVIPIDATTCQIRKAWYLEKDFQIPSERYIEDCLTSSKQVHDEDVFLCENVQLGLESKGYDRGRYVPTKQIATHLFHQRLARDLQ